MQIAVLDFDLLLGTGRETVCEEFDAGNIV